VSAFRDAIAQGVINGMDDWAGEADWQNFAADAILESPSMRREREVDDGYNLVGNALPDIHDEWFR